MELSPLDFQMLKKEYPTCPCKNCSNDNNMCGSCEDYADYTNKVNSYDKRNLTMLALGIRDVRNAYDAYKKAENAFKASVTNLAHILDDHGIHREVLADLNLPNKEINGILMDMEMTHVNVE